MSQAAYHNEKTAKKRVYFEGATQLRTGHILFYNADYATTALPATSEDVQRAYRVEVASATNLDNFAGVVCETHDAVTGPAHIDIYTPEERGQKVMVRVAAGVATTINSTFLYFNVGSFVAHRVGAVLFGKAMQTNCATWVTGTAYVVGNHVNFGGVRYRCAVAHTAAAAFHTDLTAGNWAASTAETTVLARVGDLERVRPDDLCGNTLTPAFWRQMPVGDLRTQRIDGTFREWECGGDTRASFPLCHGWADDVALEIGRTLAAGTDVTIGFQGEDMTAAFELDEVGGGAAAQDHDGYVQFFGNIISTQGGPWAFEANYVVSTVTDDDMPSFVGLCTAVTPAVNGVQRAADQEPVLALDYIGFIIRNDDGNAVDAIYQAGGGAVTPTASHITGVVVPVAAQPFSVGMFYDGKDIHVWSSLTNTVGSMTEVLAVAGAMNAAGVIDPILDTDLSAALGAAAGDLLGQDLAFTVSMKGGAGIAAADALTLQSFRFCQIAE